MKWTKNGSQVVRIMYMHSEIYFEVISVHLVSKLACNSKTAKIMIKETNKQKTDEYVGVLVGWGLLLSGVMVGWVDAGQCDGRVGV